MESEDSARSIQGSSSNHDEDASILADLLKTSTHRLCIQFINDKDLDIEYRVEHTRTNKKRVVVNGNTLSPVFGGQLPPDTEILEDVKELNAFVETHVHLNTCNDHRHASCPCHLDADPETAAKFKPSLDDVCDAGHFHHFCSRHVNYWLSHVLEPTITDSINGEPYIEDLTSDSNFVLRTAVYFRNGKEIFQSGFLIMDL